MEPVAWAKNFSAKPSIARTKQSIGARGDSGSHLPYAGPSKRDTRVGDVDVPCHRHQRLLAGVRCDDGLGAPGCKHVILGLHREPHV